MSEAFLNHIACQLREIREQGLFKAERTITTPQDVHIRVGDGETVLNMCANNYLGLAEHPEVAKAAHRRARQLGLRAVVGSLHLRHAGDSSAA